MMNKERIYNVWFNILFGMSPVEPALVPGLNRESNQIKMHRYKDS